MKLVRQYLHANGLFGVKSIAIMLFCVFHVNVFILCKCMWIFFIVFTCAQACVSVIALLSY